MLLSEIIGRPVRDADGAERGTVLDARFRRGPRNGPQEGRLQLVALVVSPRSRLPMYGYERGRMTGPRPLAALIARLHRGTHLVPWECVERVDEDAVVLGADPPRIPLDVRVPVA